VPPLLLRAAGRWAMAVRAGMWRPRCLPLDTHQRHAVPWPDAPSPAAQSVRGALQSLGRPVSVNGMPPGGRTRHCLHRDQAAGSRRRAVLSASAVGGISRSLRASGVDASCRQVAGRVGARTAIRPRWVLVQPPAATPAAALAVLPSVPSYRFRRVRPSSFRSRHRATPGSVGRGAHGRGLRIRCR